MKSEKINKLNEYIKSTNASNYPIENALLSAETDYIKNSYFKMLAVILQQGNDITASQRNLFSRMLSGVSVDYKMEDYFKQALEIEIEEYVEFNEQCKETALSYRFMIDAVLLVCCDTYDEEQLDLLAAFMESLEMSKSEVQVISKIARSILEQNSDLYWVAERESEGEILPEYISSYIGGFVEDVWEVDNNKIEVIFIEKKELDLEAIDSDWIDVEEIHIKNAIINLSVCEIDIRCVHKVLYENCVFISGKHPICLQAIENVKFANCTFKNFTNKVIKQYNVKKCEILGCQFRNCYEYYEWGVSSWRSMGCVIYGCYSYDVKGLTIIKNTEFINCGGINAYGSPSTEIISNCRAMVQNCKFENCWNYHHTEKPEESKRDPENAERLLFPKGTINDVNTIINSANFS